MLGKSACVVMWLVVLVQPAPSAGQDMGPHMEEEHTTTCEEMSRYARQSRKLLQQYLNDSVTAPPVNWTKPLFVMKEMSSGVTTLLVQLADRGQCLAYPVIKKFKPERIIHPELFNFKQSEGGKYLILMMCKEHTVYVMARPYDIPRKEKIPEEVAKAGFRGRGRSYLYRGHHWMPIPEADEWAYPPERFYTLGKIPPASFARLTQ